MIVALVAAAATITISMTQAQAANGVYDTDGDKLIEIDNLEQLDAIRYDRDGDGRADNASDNDNYAAAFPVSGSDKVCTIGCTGYELKRSLDFDSDASYASGAINFDWLSANGWSPIGTFNATFDGNENTISNLYVNKPTENGIGLFNYTGETAAIKGIGLLNADVTGRERVGALAGQNEEGTISRSYVTGTVSGAEEVGALIGVNGGNGTVSHSYAAATVTGASNGYYVGGLVGYNHGTVTSSYATGNVTGVSTVGGLVGQNKGTITASYATGAVTGNSRVGGLVGLNAINEQHGTAPISDSYATGNVIGESEVGGLVGATAASGGQGTINTSYAIGNVDGESEVGGLVGGNYYDRPGYSTTRTGRLVGNYWNTDVISAGIGDVDNPGATGKTTAELKAPTGRTGIYARWNPQYWDFGTSSEYPALKADFDGDETATALEYGGQGRTPPPTPRPTATNTPTPTPTATPTPTVTPTPTPGPAPGPALSSGYNSSCLLGSDGSVSCWDSRTGDQGAPPSGARFTAISSGYGHTCGLKTDGTLACWGSDSQGQSTPPEGEFTAVSSGFSHTCALRLDGTAACWGNNRSGQSTPPDGTPFTALNSGLVHTCGQRVDGAVVCWGGLSGTFGE